MIVYNRQINVLIGAGKNALIERMCIIDAVNSCANRVFSAERIAADTRQKLIPALQIGIFAGESKQAAAIVNKAFQLNC
jgi:hypothetical protein